jgi:DoxX-like family
MMQHTSAIALKWWGSNSARARESGKQNFRISSRPVLPLEGEERMPIRPASSEHPLETTPRATTDLASISNAQLWTSRVLSGLPAAFLLLDAGMKLFKPPFVLQANLQLGYPESAIVGIGITLLVSTLLYLLPRTAVLGAVLLTGYLGGAVAAQVRVGAPVFNIVFPVIFSALLWGALWLRDPRVRELLPLREQ